MHLVTGLGCLRHLLRDEPGPALAELNDAMTPWRIESAGVNDLLEACAASLLLTYPEAGEPAAFWAERWPRLERTISFRMPVLREMLIDFRLRSQLPAAFAGDRGAVSATRQLSRTLGRGRSAWARRVGLYTRAQAAWLDGDRERATAMAHEAARELESKGFDLFAPFAALLAARIEGAADASDRQQRLLDWLASEGFRRPDKALLWLLPAAHSWR